MSVIMSSFVQTASEQPNTETQRTMKDKTTDKIFWLIKKQTFTTTVQSLFILYFYYPFLYTTDYSNKSSSLLHQNYVQCERMYGQNAFSPQGGTVQP